MPLSRTASFVPYSFAERDEALLAPYAMRGIDSAGRRHSEPEQPYRSPYQRDRDRILHCSAFRRLSGKTQVFTGEMGDYHRTRLTHTFEVASIARTIGRALRLNEDLIEALALLHDIGHPPFGHAGEDTLAECLAAEGGFSHNRHALVIVEELEVRYHDFPGLNLSREILDCQRARAEKTSAARPPLWEAQVVDAADSMTYDAHDVDDALQMGWLTWDELRQVEWIELVVQRVRKRYVNLDADRLRQAVVHELLDCQVTDLLETCGPLVAASGCRTAEEARDSGILLGPSPELRSHKAALEAFLYARVYRHPDLMVGRQQAQDRLRALFEECVRHPEHLSPLFRQRAATRGLKLAVGEYLAGMTDRYCNRTFEKLGRGVRREVEG